MEDKVLRKGNELCNHRWRVTFSDGGVIYYWYCVKCRRLLEDKTL